MNEPVMDKRTAWIALILQSDTTKELNRIYKWALKTVEFKSDIESAYKKRLFELDGIAQIHPLHGHNIRHGRSIVKKLILLSLLGLYGCIHNSSSDISRLEPNCARQCTTAYSSCLASPGAVTTTTYDEHVWACKGSLNLCFQTCPFKE